ncbi:CMP-N-acetylneuraminate-beta-galactosamide-alpha-2,3-sialyltransferase 1 [Misgurnus anguillicaudatus]|uniref:CMP-N-acetylneuraminate-beta-galactosamide- alpha-2,3-sialyltransferase 1 n=1 Tax=Misgurnus anguillicaudatus TaxID=75329 RepID=UPI002435F752|nr:CMP-N-acetylneuraminate-beta-galactosamide-alpha-2,3-sialyltransferase 1-like [Misgurnus anguillicaudatus]XP_055075279.1 CMP-N-acetylneuraminate-beta-galactosamide-alpha-2,3-sialyltransferase 1-like [Misgurnus anguillicaudatus]
MISQSKIILQIIVIASVALSIFLYYQLSIRGFLDDWCSCKCEMDSEANLWLSERYNRSARVLMNSKNGAVDLETFNWWTSLQGASTVANFTDLVEDLFSLFPDKDHYSDSSSSRCRRCAVVGNSGNLLGSRYGALIDSNDFVIRMNEGPTAGFERDVGSMTTHRLIYPESAMDMDNNTHLVLLPFKILDLQWLISVFTTKHIDQTYMYVKPSIKADKNKVLIVHPAFIKYVYESWLQRQGKYPSTGFISIVFALHICDEVNVFGFGATSDNAWHHYFEDFVIGVNGGPHAGDFERSVITELHQKQIIMMFKGW